MRKLQKNTIYKHFKGDYYLVIDTVIHSETKEKLVLYKGLYGSLELYVRPLDMFLSEVDHEKYPNVKQKYRFEEQNIETKKEYLTDEKYEELKTSNNNIYKALELSLILFKNDTDKGGFPYLLHLFYVYRNVNTIDEKIVALLHDVIEDKKVTKEDLLDIGFDKKIVDDVIILSRNKKVTYFEYIDNLIKNASKEALVVKMADLENNMDLSRIKEPTVYDYERVEKRYTPSYEKIRNRLEEME